MHNQIDLFYRPDFSKFTSYNQCIFEYEKQRLILRIKQVNKMIEELKEDREKLRQYRQLKTQEDTEVVKETLLYLIKDAQEEPIERKILQNTVTYKHKPSDQQCDDIIYYIPSDIELTI
jgi:hypothetical protein